MDTHQGTTSAGSSPGSQQTRDELASDASRLKETATERARQEAETRKGEAARAARSASSALDKAADELAHDDNAPHWLTSAFHQAAGSIERLARGAESRSPDEMGREVTRFARQHPGPFLAASAAAGFAAARFLRAGADYRHDHPERSHDRADEETRAVQTAPMQFAGQGGTAR